MRSDSSPMPRVSVTSETPAARHALPRFLSVLFLSAQFPGYLEEEKIEHTNNTCAGTRTPDLSLCACWYVWTEYMGGCDDLHLQSTPEGSNTNTARHHTTRLRLYSSTQQRLIVCCVHSIVVISHSTHAVLLAVERGNIAHRLDDMDAC